jgi:hypothetical protein
MSEVLQLEDNLTLVINDMTATYYYNGGEFVFTGEQASGECWINNVHYEYNIDDNEIMWITNSDGAIAYVAKDAYDEDSRYAFIKTVLS